MDEIIYWSVKGLAKAIRGKTLSSKEVVEAHLRRIEEVNPRLNAVVQLTADRALADAEECDEALARGQIKGRLHGVPMTIKDSLATAGTITTAGTPGLARYVPRRDATAVRRLRGEGAILLGKTNCAELAKGIETENTVNGRTNNPYDLSRSPGGSSGGEVAIVAAGGSPLGLGSDFSGSIRSPSHFCGIAGLNPTMGRVPRTGHIPPYGGAFDTARIGPIARYVEDLALALPILAGVDWLDPTVVPMPLRDPDEVGFEDLRVAYHTYNGICLPTAETVMAVERAAEALKMVVRFVEEDSPRALKDFREIAAVLQRTANAVDQRRFLPQQLKPAEGAVEYVEGYADHWLRGAQGILPGRTVTGEELLAWTMKWHAWRGTMLSWLQQYDVVLCPVDPCPALRHGAAREAGFDLVCFTSYTKPYSMAGWPSVTVRAGNSEEGLPIGVQLVAPPGREEVALAAARYIEKALGGWQPPPL
jgi:amidase